jgi:hypothetical protein
MLTWMGASPSPSPTLPTPSASHASHLIHVVHTANSTATSLLLATWIVAVATAGLLVGAVITAIYAARAFSKQSEGIKLAREQSDRDIQQRRQAQAAQVFIVIASGVPASPGVQVLTEASNTSRQPVYDIAVKWRMNTGEFGAVAFKPQLMPEETGRFVQTWTADLGISGLGVKIEFRDAAGVHWRTNDRGELAELCGKTSLTRDRCVLEPGHEDRHSWEQPPEHQAPGTTPHEGRPSWLSARIAKRKT